MEIKKLILYIHTDKIANIDCSFNEMINEMTIIDYDIEDLSEDEREEFE